MFRIHTSEEAEKLIKQYQKELGLNEKHHLLRISLSYSLFKGHQYQDSNYDKNGGEYNEELIFQGYGGRFYELLNLHYKKDLKEEEYKVNIRYHIEEGIRILDNDYEEEKYQKKTVNNFTSFLFRVISFNNKTFEKEEMIFECPKNNTKILFNNTAKNNNQNMAIVGKSGSGKTYFVTEIMIKKIIQEYSSCKVLFLDFKGDDKFLSSKENGFIKIDLPKKKIPYNPLKALITMEGMELNEEIKEISNGISGIDGKIGIKQSGTLKKSLEKLQKEKSCSFERLDEIVREESQCEDLIVSLTDSIKNYFGDQSVDQIFKENVYLSFSRSSNEIIIACYLFMKDLWNKIKSFSETKDTSNGIRPMKYIIIIDEAHTIFKHSCFAKLIDDMIRKVRSKGVAVWLITQVAKDFKKLDSGTENLSIKLLFDVDDLEKNIKEIGLKDDKKGKIDNFGFYHNQDKIEN